MARASCVRGGSKMYSVMDGTEARDPYVSSFIPFIQRKKERKKERNEERKRESKIERKSFTLLFPSQVGKRRKRRRCKRLRRLAAQPHFISQSGSLHFFLQVLWTVLTINYIYRLDVYETM